MENNKQYDGQTVVKTNIGQVARETIQTLTATTPQKEKTLDLCDSIEKQAFNQDIYNIRYKYGYNWSCYSELANHIIRVMSENKEHGKKTIDVGCGIGWFTDMYYFNISRDVKGIDFSTLAILFHARRMYPAIEFEIADIFKYDYTGYELAILMEVLEHIDDDVGLIEKLPKGCTVYATVPFEKERMDITHVREYSINSVTERYGKIPVGSYRPPI